MKCDELEEMVLEDGIGQMCKCYGKEEVNEAIAELKARIQLDDDEMAGFLDLEEECGGGDLRNYIAELKQKLEDVQASHYAEMVDAGMRERRLRRALWLARAERYKMIEFIAREEGNLCNQMSWSQYLRKRTYNQWVDQLLRIANLANKLHNKCRAKAEQYK